LFKQNLSSESVEVTVRLEPRSSTAKRIAAFARRMPFREPPYNRRNWGHPLHSLCSYQGKLKPSIAHWILREFATEGARVLDPLGGVGTVAFEAASLGHRAVTNDKSPFAAIVGAAKLNPPPLEEVLSALRSIADQMKSIRVRQQDRVAAEFGLNASVADYYHPRTLEELLRARRVFLSAQRRTAEDNFVWASLLHVLHGNRPYALSRTSHPITPFNPTGPAEYKNVIDHVEQRIRSALAHPLPASFVRGLGIEGDFRALPDRFRRNPFDLIVTSPPFLGMRFDRPNWLRLWFCGWGESDFWETSLEFLERQQTKSTECYLDFFDAMDKLLAPDGLLVIHVGSGGNRNLALELQERSREWFSVIGEVQESVVDVERHGLKDKGLTTAHHLIFFQRP
jgi:hypothetical protein